MDWYLRGFQFSFFAFSHFNLHSAVAVAHLGQSLLSFFAQDLASLAAQQAFFKSGWEESTSSVLVSFVKGLLLSLQATLAVAKKTRMKRFTAIFIF
tara:strand:+ start:8973 stop:9260 length:288 start_codon:yes stop_codon:yes gene_type:complete